MGVKGLLPCLKSITRSVPLERYRGLTVAVDAMSWLHKGVFACDVKALATSQRNAESDRSVASELKCIQYTVHKVEILRVKFGINVILVIDGDALPSKKAENEQRREERDRAFEKAISAERAHDSRTARRYYAQSCSVTYKIRYELIKRCREIGIPFLVAPYEADAQMARLAHTGIVDLVITEDSDILVYGCPRALFKVDFDTFQGQEIQLMRDLGDNAALSFRNWTHDMFVFMCIISGCDYCKGVPGIGIKLAHKLVRIHRTPSKLFSALTAAGRMPSDFEEQFWIAFRTFRHQRVFCTSKQLIETLWPIDGSNHHDDAPNKVWPFLGEYIEPHLARKIADGTIHPSRKMTWDEALRSHRNSVPTNCCRISTDSDTQRQMDAAKRKNSNVWYSLVYGSNNVDDRSRYSKHDGKENRQDPSMLQDIPMRSMFSFFPQHKEQRNDVGVTEKAATTTESSNVTRPPLQEIYVGTESSTLHPQSSQKPSASYHRDVPIHFSDYVSQLVGRAFEPISRKRKKMENDGTKSSMYVKKIWEKCSKVRPIAHVPESEQIKVIEMEPEGVGRFKQNPTKLDLSVGYGTEEYHDFNRRTTHQPYDIFDTMPMIEFPDQIYDDFSTTTCHRTMKHNGSADYVSNDANRLQECGYLYHHDALPQSQLGSTEVHPAYLAFNVDIDSLHRSGSQQGIVNQYYGIENDVDDLRTSNPFQQLQTVMKRKRSNSNFTDDTNLEVGEIDKYFTDGVVDKGYVMSEPAPVPVEFQQLHTVRKTTRRGDSSAVSVDHYRDADVHYGTRGYDDMEYGQIGMPLVYF
ncbi:hypothetical protein ACHAWU_004853 [Discostella pseudostelligera]|uniref:Exonuclease 1 n=1 Tax=Discostella pseudostelligera TaxID=259834 RepID=A0ABD3M2J8_9STRA